MILHFAHLFLTDADTFMVTASWSYQCVSGHPSKTCM